VLDYRRKFIEAAQRYNELSYRSIISEEERMAALKNALICTVLASAGKPMRIAYHIKLRERHTRMCCFRLSYTRHRKFVFVALAFFQYFSF